MSNDKKYLGIRFPFTAQDDVGFFVDMDYDPYKELKSDIIHLLFTPIGSRYRDPNFGSNLLRYIFEPEDNKTIDDIKEEIQSSIKKNFSGVKIVELTIVESELDTKMYDITIQYVIDQGSFLTKDTINISI